MENIMDKEYKYFNVFIAKTHQLYSSEDGLNLLQLESLIMDLSELILDKPLAQDSIRLKCSDLISVIFSFCQSINILQPIKPSTEMIPRKIKSREAVVRLMASGKKLAYKYAMTKFLDNKQNIWLDFKITFQDITELLWNICDMKSIHDLLSYKIQTYCHYHIIIGKIHTILAKPHLSDEFENKSIFPWKYFWHPASKKLLNYMGECIKAPLGVEFSLDEIIDHFYDQMIHKIEDHEESEDSVLAEIKDLFQLEPEEFCLRDRRSLQWPLLQHIYSLPFEDIWNSKYLDIPKRERVKGELSGIIKEAKSTSLLRKPLLRKSTVRQISVEHYEGQPITRSSPGSQLGTSERGNRDSTDPTPQHQPTRPISTRSTSPISE